MSPDKRVAGQAGPSVQGAGGYMASASEVVYKSDATARYTADDWVGLALAALDQADVTPDQLARAYRHGKGDTVRVLVELELRCWACEVERGAAPAGGHFHSCDESRGAFTGDAGPSSPRQMAAEGLAGQATATGILKAGR